LILVVKVGGDLLADGLSQELMDEMEALNGEHWLILVHGGGDIVTDISTKLGHEPRFVVSPRGFRSRYTDKETAEIYTMVMAGKINKEIVSSLQGRGIPAIGLSGLDGGLMKARRKKQIIIMNERGRKMLIGYLPVVSSIAMGEEGEPLNVDGDRAAASVASALGADRLILLTDVEGVHIDGSHIGELYVSEAREIMDKVGAGMITKIYAAVEAVERGVDEVVIASGFGEAAILEALDHGRGTVIRG
jgi:acetylglutamate/LysW-gamma-L-alpha-aminoadipate kinase